jgi:hypothetical protein
LDYLAALVTDEALRGQRPLLDVTYITIWQVGARLVGTLLAQAFLGPAGWLLASLTRWLVGQNSSAGAGEPGAAEDS